MNETTKLIIATNKGIEHSLPCLVGDVGAEALESGELLLGLRSGSSISSSRGRCGSLGCSLCLSLHGGLLSLQLRTETSLRVGGGGGLAVRGLGLQTRSDALQRSRRVGIEVSHGRFGSEKATCADLTPVRARRAPDLARSRSADNNRRNLESRLRRQSSCRRSDPAPRHASEDGTAQRGHISNLLTDSPSKRNPRVETSAVSTVQRWNAPSGRTQARSGWTAV